jgi:hypothetical protein
VGEEGAADDADRVEVRQARDDLVAGQEQQGLGPWVGECAAQPGTHDLITVSLGGVSA